MKLPRKTQLHLWFVKLDEDLYQGSHALLLNAEEMKRAVKFKFELHRKRYIIARAGLRSILGQYLDLPPQDVQILNTPEGKPFIPDSELQFNLSHSHDRALYALSFQNPVGVDLEKIRDNYNEAVAERFFSPEEYERFSQLPPQQKQLQFFKIWAGKEALVKALGEGLGFSLSSFTIPDQGQSDAIRFENQGRPALWHLVPLDLFPDYQAACVTRHKIKQLAYFEWGAEGKRAWRQEEDRSSP